MSRRGSRIAVLTTGIALSLAIPVCFTLAQGRATPARVAPLPSVQLSGLDYVSVAAAATQLGLTGAWTEKDKTYSLQGSGRRIDLETGSREIQVDGLRLHLGNAVTLSRGQLHLSRIDYEHTLLPLLRPDLAAFSPVVPRTIVIDPGHGGNDNGTSNSELGLLEKDLTLDVSRRLQQMLEGAGFRVQLTRADDSNPTFVRRAEIAQNAAADLFISIHFNALAADTRTSGSEVFVFTPAGQRSTASWATGDPDIEANASPVNRFDPSSSLLAHSIHRALLTGLRTSDRGQKTGHLGVLRRIQAPAVLVEAVFLSNPDEARRVATAEYREQVARAIAGGVATYADTMRTLARTGQ